MVQYRFHKAVMVDTATGENVCRWEFHPHFHTICSTTAVLIQSASEEGLGKLENSLFRPSWPSIMPHDSCPSCVNVGQGSLHSAGNTNETGASCTHPNLLGSSLLTNFAGGSVLIWNSFLVRIQKPCQNTFVYCSLCGGLEILSQRVICSRFFLFFGNWYEGCLVGVGLDSSK